MRAKLWVNLDMSQFTLTRELIQSLNVAARSGNEISSDWLARNGQTVGLKSDFREYLHWNSRTYMFNLIAPDLHSLLPSGMFAPLDIFPNSDQYRIESVSGIVYVYSQQGIPCGLYREALNAYPNAKRIEAVVHWEPFQGERRYQMRIEGTKTLEEFSAISVRLRTGTCTPVTPWP